MNFTSTVIINKPKEMVANYFANPEYLTEYQEGFQKKELVSGEAGKVNAVSNLFYASGKRKMMLTETIVVNNLPDEFMAQYHHKFTDNTMKSTFTSIDENQTRYDAEIHYTAFRGFMVNTMAFLAPKFFKKQVDKWLLNFKTFLEKQ
jgi:hypothetical protein